MEKLSKRSNKELEIMLMLVGASVRKLNTSNNYVIDHTDRAGTFFFDVRQHQQEPDYVSGPNKRTLLIKAVYALIRGEKIYVPENP